MEYKFLTVDEVATILKVNKMTIYRYIKSKKINALRIGNDLRIKQQELDVFINEREIK